MSDDQRTVRIDQAPRGARIRFELDVAAVWTSDIDGLTDVADGQSRYITAPADTLVTVIREPAERQEEQP